MYLPFRARQVVHDLCHELRKHPLADYAALTPDAGLLAALLDHGLAIGTGGAIDLLDRARDLATGAGPAPARAFGLALVLSDALSVRLLDDPLPHGSAAVPAGLNPALARALRQGLRQAQFTAAEDAPAAADMVSLSADAVCGALRAIIAAATEDDLLSLAAGDAHADPQDHLGPLRQVVRHQAGVIAPGQAYFPAEAFELVSHDPGHPQWRLAIALVLLNAVVTQDALGHAEYRWQCQGDHLRTQPRGQVGALLAAFRHLYESHPGWEPRDLAAHDRPGIVPPLPAADDLSGPEVLDGR